MSIGWAAHALYSELKSDPAFKAGGSVCDLGSQDLVSGQIGGDESSTLAYYQRLGFSRYVCIDIDGRNGSLPLDLNWATAIQVGERFDVVTNHGTTEHCLNQLNCFTFMHDLTKPGGLMIHMVPSWPWVNYQDCFFFVTTELFLNLSDANHYEQVRCEYFDDPHLGKYVKAALRRTSAAPFVVPIQRFYHLPGKTTSVPCSPSS